MAIPFKTQFPFYLNKETKSRGIPQAAQATTTSILLDTSGGRNRGFG
jgi:hypothetical protein